MTHPRPFFLVTGGMAVLIFVGLEWWHQERFDDLGTTLGAKNATIESLEKENNRLRIAAGIDRADSRTALSVLTNEQLASKTNEIVRALREMIQRSDARLKRIEKELPNDENLPEAEQRKRFLRLIAIQNEEAEKINAAFGSESILVLNELQRRIPEKQREHIIGAGIRLPLAEPWNEDQDARLLFNIHLGVFTLSQLPIFANELESLSRLLPPD